MNDTEELSEFWTEKYAPKTLDDMVLCDEQRTLIANMIASKRRFNLLLAGKPGIGKTTLANIIAKTLNGTVCYIPCGIRGTVATAQGELKNFCDSLSMEGRQKIVILDELDSASANQDSSFQKTLRNIVNEAKDTMFIATCNYADNVILPIRSRLKGVFELKFEPKDLAVRIQHILDSEHVKYTKESINHFAKIVVKTCYPDVRQIISILADSCTTGELVVSESIVKKVSNDFVKDIVNKAMTAKNLLALRQFYITSKDQIGDYREFSSAIFNYMLDNNLVKSPDTVLRLSNIIYQMNIVVDPEVQFFAFITIINRDANSRK